MESNNQLKTTNEPDDASQFLIVRCEQQKEYFKIVYQPPVTENGNPGPVPSLFLSASNDDKPLLMKNTVNKSKLALRSRDAEHFDPDHPAKLSSWVSGTGKEFCYICCTEVPKKKRNRRRRYLCIFKPRADGLEETDYITGCKSRKDHDKPDKMKHMLFSLIKSCKTTNQDESKASKDKISEGGTYTTE